MFDPRCPKENDPSAGANWGRHSSDAMGEHGIRSPIIKCSRRIWFQADSRKSERANYATQSHRAHFENRPIYQMSASRCFAEQNRWTSDTLHRVMND